jgi:hypothetical protein
MPHFCSGEKDELASHVPFAPHGLDPSLAVSASSSASMAVTLPLNVGPTTTTECVLLERRVALNSASTSATAADLFGLAVGMRGSASSSYLVALMASSRAVALTTEVA